MKIGILIPTRGRNQFLQQAIRMVCAQQGPQLLYSVIDYPPKSDAVDITARYRYGCELLFTRGCDAVLFWEDDDWYAPTYVKTMVSKWLSAGKPEAFGIANSAYYHILERKYFLINHPGRASAYCTLVTPAVMNILWPSDDYPYLDVEIWKQLNGKTFIPQHPICLGIKHGIGMVGGGCHNGDSKHYSKPDPDGEYLRSIVGNDFNFYNELRNAQIFKK